MMTRTKRHALVLQAGGLVVRLTTLSRKKFDIEKNSEMSRREAKSDSEYFLIKENYRCKTARRNN